MRLAVLLMVLPGCLGTLHKSGCSESGPAVADDEPTAVGPASEVLDRVVGVGTVDAILASESSVVPATWSVQRGQGSARWIEAEVVETVTRTDGIGSFTPDVAVVCTDRLAVPVTLSIFTEGGEVEVATAGEVSVRAADPDSPVSIHGHSPFGDATLPDVESEDPASYVDKQAFASVDGLGGPGPVTGSAGWEGTQVTDEWVKHATVRVLEFP